MIVTRIFASCLAVVVFTALGAASSEDVKLNNTSNANSTATATPVADESNETLATSTTTSNSVAGNGSAAAGDENTGGSGHTSAATNANETAAAAGRNNVGDVPTIPNDELQTRYGTVIYSSVFFSNGDLTPATPYPKDPYNATFWRQGLNRLTNMGKVQLYQLGMWLANRYNGLLLGGAYNPNLTKIESGTSDYMFEGAACTSAGLFPPLGDQKWNQLLNWQPVSILRNAVEINKAAYVLNTCKKYDEEITRVSELSVWQKYTRSHQDIIDAIGNGTGLSFREADVYNTMQTIFYLYSELNAEKNDNLSLPSWTTRVYPKPMDTMAEKYLELISYSSVTRKYKAGPLLQTIVNNTQSKIDGNITEKLHLYSGNVIGLSTMMNGLGVFNSQIPLAASALLIELRKRNTNYIVTVSIRNGTEHPYLLKIPNCHPECLFDQFLNITANMTSQNWDDECDKLFEVNISYSTPLLIAGLIVLCVLFFLFALLFIKLCRCLATKKGKLFYNK